MSKYKDLTKNDEAWNQLFQKYGILQQVQKDSYFEISATQINKVREARLMTKFDHRINLPKIFQTHKLSILPISRSKYKIGQFQAYYQLSKDCELDQDDPTMIEFPSHIETIDYTNLYSESAAISCAFNAGILNDLMGETLFHTVSGRMSSGKFDFKINNVLGEVPYHLSVENSQCEIDGGFEGESCFLLIEAKNITIDDFLIRQIYYPFRLWSNKTSKKVVPVFMTYSKDIFKFFIFEFIDYDNYNSLQLVRQKNYAIGLEEIQSEDISKLFRSIQLIPEPPVPLPQADSFDRLVDLLTMLMDKELTTDEITINYAFDLRQTDYYTNAGRYLGLIEKYKDSISLETGYKLSPEGLKIMEKRHKQKYLRLFEKILQHKVFYEVFALSIKEGAVPSRGRVVDVMKTCQIKLSKSTLLRRSQTIQKWITWIWKQIS